jgi:hypothetical protein
MDLRESGFGSVNWIHLAQDKDHYTLRHQNTSFKVAAKSYNVATRTAELKQVGRFAGLLTSTCCNIFICNRINEMFLLLHSSFLSLYNNTFIIHLPWHIILLIKEKSFSAF